MKEKNGMSLCGVLLVIFIILKMTSNITWSWFWVFSPVWLPIAGFGGLIIGAGVIILIDDLRRGW